MAEEFQWDDPDIPSQSNSANNQSIPKHWRSGLNNISAENLRKPPLPQTQSNTSNSTTNYHFPPPPRRSPPCPFPFSGPACQIRGVCWGRPSAGGARWSPDGHHCQCSLSWLFQGPPRCQSLSPVFLGCVAGLCVLLLAAMVGCNARSIREWYFQFQLKETSFEDHVIATNPLAAFLPHHDQLVHQWKAEYQEYQARRRSSQPDFNMTSMVGDHLDDMMTRGSVTIDLLRGRERQYRQYSVAKGLSWFAPSTALLIDVPELLMDSNVVDEQTTKFSTVSQPEGISDFSLNGNDDL